MKKVFLMFILLITTICTWSLAEVIGVPGNYSTIQEAIDSAADGDTVLVEPGTYVENIDFHGHAVILASQFLTTGERSYVESTVIDGNADSSTISIENSEPAGTAVIGFSIRNGLGTGDWPFVRGGGIHISGGAQPSIIHCDIYDNECVGSSNRGAGIYANSSYAFISNCRLWGNTSGSGAGISIGNGADGTAVDSCDIFSNTGAGIQISYSQNVTINRTMVHHNSGWGIRNFDSDNVVVSHCTITENEDAGLHVGAGSGSEDVMYMVNSILYNNTVNWEINTDSMLVSTYSIIEGGTDSLWFGEGCMDLDPLFADEFYKLDASSPAIDAGDPGSEYDPDLTITDMGAHYYPQPVGIHGRNGSRPAGFTLHQNYPNPFNPGTKIYFQLETAQQVKITIFDVLGQKVRTLLDGQMNEGLHHVDWNGVNDAGEKISSGIYLYQMRAGSYSETRSMHLVQ